MSKNVVSNPFVQSLKAQMLSRLPELADGIDVNPRSAWVKGEVSPAAQKVLKDAGFIVCSKGWYFTHDCTKMPKFVTVAPAQAQKPVVKAEKPAKQWEELPEATRAQIVRKFQKAYPGAIVEVRGTWVFLIGGVFQTNAEYRTRAKADGFHFGFKTKEWARALTQEELAVKGEPKAKSAPAEKAPAPVEFNPQTAKELADLSEIVIRARKGELTRDQMIAAMKEACPF